MTKPRESGQPGLFEGRSLVIGTKHGKDRVIIPLVDETLGTSSFATTDFDTDILGTFTGEIERTEDPVSTLRRKCLTAMDLNGCSLGISSEGSFGPHPLIPFVTADEEFLIFIDRENDLEIVHREISTDTNFSGTEVETREQLFTFAEKARFPSHALILRDSRNGNKAVVKGITETETLRRRFEEMLSNHGSAYVETDMRAMYNPTRMQVIEKATKGLLEKLLSLCPACGTPGFIVTDTVRGLPCSLCHSPTRSMMSLIQVCRKCGHTESMGRPDGKTVEDPMHCDSCNP